MWAGAFFLLLQRGLDRRVRRRRPTVPFEGRSCAGLAAAGAVGRRPFRPCVPRAPEAR